LLMSQTDPRIDPTRVIKYLRTAVQSLVDALESAPGAPAWTLQVLPESERREMLERFNPAIELHPLERGLQRLFEEQVRLRPKAPAVTHEGDSLSYEELNARANQLARQLRSRGVGRDVLVG